MKQKTGVDVTVVIRCNNTECEHLKAMDNHAWRNKIEGICFEYQAPKTKGEK